MGLCRFAGTRHNVQLRSLFVRGTSWSVAVVDGNSNREEQMRAGSMLFAGVVAVMLVGSSVLQGQEAQGASKPAQETSKGKSLQLTGCLEKGADAGSFMLNAATEPSAAKETSKAAESKNYHVMTKDASLALDKHVGHTVQITGTIDPSAMGAAKSAPGATGTTGKAGDMPHVTVTALKHVAASCK